MTFSRKTRTLLLTAVVAIGLLTTAVFAKTICHVCKGTGKILEVTKQCPLHNPLFCTNCDGSGLVGPPCPYCGGLGYTLTSAEKEAERKARAKADAKARAENEEYLVKKAKEDSIAAVEKANKEADLKARGITNKRRSVDIDGKITQNAEVIRRTYHLRKDNGEGKITVRLIINEFGKVISIKLLESEINDSNLESVIISTIKNIDFKKINEPGDLTEYTHEFYFSPWR